MQLQNIHCYLKAVSCWQCLHERLVRVFGVVAGTSPVEYDYQCFSATDDTPCSPYSDCKVLVHIILPV